jgi:RND family efflux transporter MFP subunit
MNLRVGQRIEAFHLSSKSDFHKGRITVLSPRVDPETRLARVAARVDNSNGHLRLGMFLTARVYVENGRPVLSVPEESVLRVNGEETVYRPDPKDKDAFVPTPVRIGERRGGRVEILSGLKAGDSVVEKGTFYLKSAQMKAAMGDAHAH